MELLATDLFQQLRHCNLLLAGLVLPSHVSCNFGHIPIPNILSDSMQYTQQMAHITSES